MKKAAFLFFRVEVGNAACAVQYLVVVQTMLVRCPKNLDFTVFQKVSLSNLIFIRAGIPVEYHIFPGCYHSFEIAVPDSHYGKMAYNLMYSALRRAFGTKK